MKKLFLDACLSLSFILLGGCTSDETKVQEIALQEAKDIYMRDLRNDLERGVSGKKNLQKTAALILTERSQFEVQKVEIQGERALAVVQALTVPLAARMALIEIIGKLDEKKERNFNVSNALHLILRQMELTETRSLQVYKIQLTKSGGWQALRESAEKEVAK